MDTLRVLSDLLAWVPTLGLLVVAALISYSRIFEKNPASVALLVTAVCWVWAQSATVLVADLAEKKALYFIQYIALAFIPPTWISTSLRFAGLKDRFRRTLFWALLSLSVVFIAVIVTTEQTLWFFSKIELPVNSRTFIKSPAVGYWVFLFFVFSSVGYGLYHIGKSRRVFSALDRRRALLIFLAVLVPACAGLLDTFHIVIIPGVALAPWSTLFSVVLILYGIWRAKLLEPVPRAHEIVVQNMSDPVIVLGSNQTVDWVNESAKKMLNETKLEPGMTVAKFLPPLADSVPQLREGQETVLVWGDREFRVKATSVQDSKSGLEALAIVFHDVTTLKAEQSRLESLVDERTALLAETNQVLEAEVIRYQETQLRLERLLAEKEMLLQEVHHRVKNNLQIIMSLVNLQARRISEDSEVLAPLEAMKGRIRSISLVHERMYRTSFGNGLDFREYLEELVRGIGALYTQTDVQLEIRTDSGSVFAGVDFSIDFGLMVNELVTNAFKHGIVPSGKGLVTVGLELKDGKLHLTVQDSGAGFEEKSDGDRPSSLGLSIVRSILKKYNAELHIRKNDGTLVEVVIPWEGP